MEILLNKVVDLKQVADLCAVGIKRKPVVPRDRKAWHVSNLLHSARSIIKGEVKYDEGSAPNGIMALGLIWEAAVDCYMLDYATQEGGFYTPDVESVKDGILGSLDGIMYLPDMGWLVCETKLRFSLGEDMPMNHAQQIRAYCHLAETDLACYITGHISTTPPTARAALSIVRFTRQAIAETWQGIVNTKEHLESKGCVPQGSKTRLTV